MKYNKILLLFFKDIYPKFKEVIFFITPRINLIKLIAKIIQNNEKKNSNLNFTIVFWPRRTIMCKEALERAGVSIFFLKNTNYF